jgi:2-hydroxy-3-keto-5-methylthiopentenyl-1-phosphate phosphatase
MVFGLEFDYDESGNYAYFPDQTLKYESGKKNTVTKLRTKFPEEKFAVIGDSVSDLHAGEAADLFV